MIYVFGGGDNTGILLRSADSLDVMLKLKIDKACSQGSFIVTTDDPECEGKRC